MNASADPSASQVLVKSSSACGSIFGTGAAWTGAAAAGLAAAEGSADAAPTVNAIPIATPQTAAANLKLISSSCADAASRQKTWASTILWIVWLNRNWTLVPSNLTCRSGTAA